MSVESRISENEDYMRYVVLISEIREHGGNTVLREEDG